MQKKRRTKVLSVHVHSNYLLYDYPSIFHKFIDSIYDELKQEIDTSLLSKLGELSRPQVQNAIISQLPPLVDHAKRRTIV